jgi:hypothetical protein
MRAFVGNGAPPPWGLGFFLVTGVFGDAQLFEP